MERWSEPNMDPELFKDIAHSLTGISIGASLYSLAIHVPKIGHGPIHIGFTCISISWMIAVFAVGSVLSEIPPEPTTWRGYLYLTGLILGAIGFVVAARDFRKTWR